MKIVFPTQILMANFSCSRHSFINLPVPIRWKDITEPQMAPFSTHTGQKSATWGIKFWKLFVKNIVTIIHYSNLNLLQINNCSVEFMSKHRKIDLHFLIISHSWDGTSGWNTSVWMTSTLLFCTVRFNTMVADALHNQQEPVHAV